MMVMSSKHSSSIRNLIGFILIFAAAYVRSDTSDGTTVGTTDAPPGDTDPVNSNGPVTFFDLFSADRKFITIQPGYTHESNDVKVDATSAENPVSTIETSPAVNSEVKESSSEKMEDTASGNASSEIKDSSDQKAVNADFEQSSNNTPSSEVNKDSKSSGSSTVYVPTAEALGLSSTKTHTFEKGSDDSILGESRNSSLKTAKEAFLREAASLKTKIEKNLAAASNNTIIFQKSSYKIIGPSVFPKPSDVDGKGLIPILKPTFGKHRPHADAVFVLGCKCKFLTYFIFVASCGRLALLEISCLRFQSWMW